MLRRGKQQPTPSETITADDHQDEQDDPPFVESMATVGVSIDNGELPQFAYSGTLYCYTFLIVDIVLDSSS
jgi:hypothetical protein